MPTYLYLTKQEWVTTWEQGGVVPISLASRYKSVKRSGTRTPDENVIHRSPIDIRTLKSVGIHIEDVRGLNINGYRHNGVAIPNITNAAFYNEDGLIQSFATKASAEIARRLGKAACVEIVDFDALKSAIDAQLGVVGIAKACAYTFDHQRNHFLKSIADIWQYEFRIFWPLLEEGLVEIPPGISRRVRL